MKRLSDEQINTIAELLKEGKPLPEEYRWLLFEGKQETELIYAGKTREVDVLTDTMAVPLQKVKVFGDVKEDEWYNILIFGDNLQILKTLLKMKEDGKLKSPDGSRGVKLIYIDTPFATKQEFRAKNGEKAYQDKIIGSKFLEWLRQRLILLRDLLSDDGSIYIHLDWKKVHYVKTLMDEIFGEENFIREVIWRIGWVSGFKSVADNWVRNHDTILYYAKDAEQVIFNKIYTPYPIDYERWGGRPKGQGLAIEDVWGVFPQEGVTSLQVVSFASQYTGFPTQKPEGLLGRIITASSNEGDLVLDAFAGSGTTGAVAEKLNRRWIMIDSSKFAIYTIIKRMLNLKQDIGNKGKSLTPKLFAVYNAGLYDMKILKELPFVEYHKFALELFQCKDEPHTLAGIDLDGYFGQDHVLVFKWKKNGDKSEYVMDRGFIDNLHSILGERIGKRFFIIAPAASVLFLEDYIEKDRIKYYVLRIPYSIIDELHKKNFKLLEQPLSADISEVNKVMEQVGFDFIYSPDIECDYYIEKQKDKLYEKAVIKIKKFRSNIISKKPIPEDELGFRALSMVMIDYDFNGEYFDMDDKWFVQDLEKNNYEVRFPIERMKDKVMIVYMDMYGNEKKEVKGLKDFERRR